MHVPTLFGVIKRRFLINYRADPEVIKRILPAPFEPKLHRGHAIADICLIRLESIRPLGLPGFIGIEYGHTELGMRQFKHSALTDG